MNQDSVNVNEQKDSAQWIIDQTIERHGGALYEHSETNFVFRDRAYRRRMMNGDFQYERRFINPEDSTQEIRDVLTNEEFYREINGQRIETSYKEDSMYSNSVNSVIYFGALPYGLNDQAVNKYYLGKEEIKGQEYHKIKVSFEEEGGGKDFEDVFLYFIHPEKYTMDYLAYLYYTDGGGIRFREAFNTREINGILFQDYKNYKMDFDQDLMEVALQFNQDSLVLLSEILTEEVKVSILTP